MNHRKQYTKSTVYHGQTSENVIDEAQALTGDKLVDAYLKYVETLHRSSDGRAD